MRREILFQRNDGVTDSAKIRVRSHFGYVKLSIQIGTVTKTYPLTFGHINDAYHHAMRSITLYREHAVL